MFSRSGFRAVLSLAFGLIALISFAGCGSGYANVVTLSVKTLDLGSSPVAVTSTVAQTVLLTTGSSPVALSAITITGTNASSFAQTSTCPASLPALSSCVITVTLTPAAVGPLTATLSVTDNAPNSPQTVALTGTGTVSAATAVLTPTAIDFGSQTVGAPAISQTVTLSNHGSASLTLTSLTLAGINPSGASTPYKLSGTCSIATPVAAGSACTLVVSYSPTAAGTQTASLTLADNAANSPQVVPISGTAYSGLPLTATVLAGSQPVSGAAVQLLAAGTTGNGSSPLSLSAAPLITDASGSVIIPGQYNCPAARTQIYLVSRGGTVGSARAANPGLTMLSAIGACSSITPNLKFVVDEATTVAGIAALAPFYSAGGSIGASATNTLGLANAFSTATELADSSTGASPGSTLPGNAASPAPRVNSLANLINSCAVSATACTGFFSSATPQGGTVPQNTLDATYNTIHNPASNVAALYAASLASTAYAPVLTNAPSDWTFFLTFSGGGMNSPSGIGVDSQGAVWVANYFNVASRFTPLGAPVVAGGITGSGLNNSYGLAVDLSDNAWIPNEMPRTSAGIGSVSVLAPDGTSRAGTTGYIAGGLNYPIALAIDPNTTAWVVDYGDGYVTLLDPSGKPLSGANGYTTPYFAFPVAVAIDQNHFGWIANQSATTVTRVAPDGSSFLNFDCCNGASGLAFDQGNNAWIANYYGSSVSLISGSGTILSKGTYTGAGALDHPQGIAVDGAGTVWVANFRAPYLTALAGTQTGSPGSSLSPSTGFGADAGLLEAYAIAIDASGNLWVTNFGSNTITKFIGLAAPVRTPLSGLPQLP